MECLQIVTISNGTYMVHWNFSPTYLKCGSVSARMSMNRFLTGFSGFFSAFFHNIRGWGTPDAWHFIKRVLPDLTWVSSGIAFHFGGTAKNLVVRHSRHLVAEFISSFLLYFWVQASLLFTLQEECIWKVGGECCDVNWKNATGHWTKWDKIYCRDQNSTYLSPI